MVDITLNQIGNKVKVASWSRLQDRAPEYARARVYRLLFVQSEHDAVSCVLERFIVVMIILATGVLVVSSIPGLDATLHRVLWLIEIAVATLFALEYVARLWSITASRSYNHPGPATVEIITDADLI